MNKPESFAAAKTNLSNNLTAIMTKLNYTPTLMAMQLNSISSTNVLSTDVTSWISGEKLPNLYQLYKISQLLEISVDALFSPDFTINTSSTLVTNNTPKVEKTTMATKNTVIAITKNTKRRMDEVVTAHTSSKNYNPFLANKIYSANMTLKEIASEVGVSTRSLRDYAFYGTTVPSDVATNLVKLFKTSYRNLGIYFNAETDRYNHMTVTVKN